MANILLAEDDISMLNFLCGALEKAGHRVTAKPDGLQALEELEQNQGYDLLLADIVMPGMDGIELSQKASDMAPHIKTMFITGFAAVALGQRNPERAHAQVLSKPFHLSELVKQVNAILTA